MSLPPHDPAANPSRASTGGQRRPAPPAPPRPSPAAQNHGQPAGGQGYYQASYPQQNQPTPQFATTGAGTGHGATPGGTPGFAASLFDVRFRSYVTPRILTVVYIVAIVLIGIGILAGLGVSVFGFVAAADLSSFSGGEGGGFLVFLGIVNLLLTPILAFFALLLVRLGLEFVSSHFAMAQHLKEIRDNGAT